MACKACRARKIKCDQTRPICHNCKIRSSQCTYAGERQMRRRAHSRTAGHRPSLSSMTTDHARTLSSIHALQLPPEPIREESEQDQVGWRIHDANPMVRFPEIPEDDLALVLDQILDSKDGDYEQAYQPALWIRTEHGDEYTGPSSGISIISDLGLNWIRNHVPDSEALCDTIQNLRGIILTQLTQPKCIPKGTRRGIASPVAELKPPSVIRKYVNAYFSHVQTIFPVLDRAQFETQLKTYGTDSSCAPCSWKALLSAVLASGCRASLSSETADAFQQSSHESWEYFENALSYEPQIVHGGTDLMAVQAFAVLTIFAQGLSCPQRLEFTLCSIVTRLAQSIGIYRQAPREWNLSEEDKLHRARVFWVVYSLDKTIALRSGRPPVIHDDDISVSFPRGIDMSRSDCLHQREEVANKTFDFFLVFTRLARICGTVSRRLYSEAALSLSSTKLSPAFYRLLDDLEKWKRAIPEDIQPGRFSGRTAESHGLSGFQLLVLHYSYAYVLCAICRRFAPLFTERDKEIPSITEEVMKKNIDAARSMALLTKHLDVESLTPAWLGFYYPFTALATIFVHVVCHPRAASTGNDIALMGVIVGFFGRLEYITSGEVAFTKAGEFVQLARRITDRSATAVSSSPLVYQAHERDAVDQDLQRHRSDALEGRNSADYFCRDIIGPRGDSGCKNVTENAQWTLDPGSNVASQILFSDVMGILETNTAEISDERWARDWVPTSS